ncbi:MAG: T9SS type A sorting domain-containing protein [Flavobacteriales bacterium]
MKQDINYPCINDSHYSRGYTFIDLNPVIDFKIKQYRQRTTNVDGWGTIITPKGTFQALRLRHDISEIDSVYQTFFGAGQWFGTPPIQRTEYEWFSNGEKEWILKATETNGTVNQVEYQEDYLGLDASLIESRLDVFIGPNPVQETVHIDAKSPVCLAQVFDCTGRMVLSTSLNKVLNYSLDLSALSTGTYRLILNGVHGSKEFPLVKF